MLWCVYAQPCYPHVPMLALTMLPMLAQQARPTMHCILLVMDVLLGGGGGGGGGGGHPAKLSKYLAPVLDFEVGRSAITVLLRNGMLLRTN